MKIFERLKLASISVLVVVGVAACDKPGPAERAGANIDRSVDMVGQKISNAADKAGEKMSQQGAKAGRVIDDSEITAKVKAAIFAEPGLKTLQISVDTKKGVVTLSGSVTSRANSVTAASLARSVDGVSDVENHLVNKMN